MNKLPSEIISHITRCLLDEDIVEEEDTVDARPIILLTHVCRYWRESIISTPEHWTWISNRSRSLTILSLQRAKAAPLRISLDMDQIKESPWFSDLIAPHIQNTETLYIDSISTTKELSQMFPNFPWSMPNLRLLSFSLQPRQAELDWSINPLGSSTPTLTHLSLIDISLSPSFLRLRTLTNLTFLYNRTSLPLPLDRLLDFLEENRSLEHVDLEIPSAEFALRSSRRRIPIRNRLRSLKIVSANAMDVKALISNIALQEGAHLNIALYDWNAGSKDLFSIVSMTHLSNLRPTTIMEYNPDHKVVRLLGSSGSLSFYAFGLRNPFTRLHPPHLANVRVFRLTRTPKNHSDRIVFSPSSLPALETLAIEYGATVSPLLSALILDPSSSPSLSTLAFLDCDLDEGVMKQLVRFASSRKKTTSAWLYRVVIVNSKGALPTVASVERLGKHVPVVDVRAGTKLPADLV